MAEIMRGDEGVIDLLLDQHMQIKQLFADVLNAAGERKNELFDDLVELLTAHEAAEAEIVHLNARDRIDDGYAIVGARLEEEAEVERELTALEELGVDHPEFDTRLRQLAEDVVRHAAAEEAEEFLPLQDSLSSTELVTMADDVREFETRS